MEEIEEHEDRERNKQQALERVNKFIDYGEDFMKRFMTVYDELFDSLSEPLRKCMESLIEAYLSKGEDYGYVTFDQADYETEEYKNYQTLRANHLKFLNSPGFSTRESMFFIDMSPIDSFSWDYNNELMHIVPNITFIGIALYRNEQILNNN